MISIGRFQRDTAENLRKKLEELSKDCFWSPRFLVCPAGGECEVWAETDYDFSTDFDNKPQDAEKEFGSTMLHLLVSVIAFGANQ